MDSKQKKAHHVKEVDWAKAGKQKRKEIIGETLTNSVHLEPRHQE